MNAPNMVRRLDPGHWLTIIAAGVQVVATVAVVSWRVGAVERRLETLDQRLWELGRRSATTAAVWRPCPPDATRVVLRTEAAQ